MIQRKIIVVHTYYQLRGGEDAVFEEEVELLRQHGHHVEVFSLHNAELSELSPIHAAAKTIWNFEVAQRFAKLCEQFEPEIVHCHNIFPLMSPAVFSVSRKYNAKVVQTVHNYRLACANALFFRENQVCEICSGKTLPLAGVLHKCYRNSLPASAVTVAMTGLHKLIGTWQSSVDVYIALTKFAEQKLIENGIPGEKIYVKPNFVATKREYTSNNQGDYIAFIGRLSPEKGIEFLLKTLSVHHFPWKIKILGTGPLESTLCEYSERYSNIEFYGHTSADNVLEIMSNARCVVVPSLWFETFGRIVAESFSVGTPVVVSDIGALSELVVDGKTGFRFMPGNEHDCIAAIEKIYAMTHNEYLDMRKNCRLEFENKYTPERNIALLEQIYSKII